MALTQKDLLDWCLPDGERVFGAAQAPWARRTAMVSTDHADYAWGLADKKGPRRDFLGVSLNARGEPTEMWLFRTREDFEVARAPVPETLEEIEAWAKMVGRLCQGVIHDL